MYRNRDHEQFDAIVAWLREDDPRFMRRVEASAPRPSRRWAWLLLVGLVSVVLGLWLGRYGLAGLMGTAIALPGRTWRGLDEQAPDCPIARSAGAIRPQGTRTTSDLLTSRSGSPPVWMDR